MARLNKELIALNLLTCSTIKEAAEKSGVGLTTIRRLKKDASFQELLRRTKNEIFQDTMNKIQADCMKSFEALQAIRDNPNATDASRVSAAKTILDLGNSMYEDENIVQRLANIERELSSDN